MIVALTFAVVTALLAAGLGLAIGRAANAFPALDGGSGDGSYAAFCEAAPDDSDCLTD